MEKANAFCTAFFEYFISEQVNQKMAEVVVDMQEVPYEEALAFCKRNEKLLGEVYSEVWKVIERLAKKSK